MKSIIINIMSISIINNFKFESGVIFEVKFDDLSNEASKKDKYQWFLIHNDLRYNLQFLSMDNGIRKLVSGGDMFVDLDVDNLILSFGNQTYELKSIA
jgi:hypothetical protein